jgi:hypothetical protein
MEGQFSYQDFDLLIEPGPPGSYRAGVLRSPAGECAGAIHAAVLETGAGKPRAQARPEPPPHLRARSPESAPLKDFGGKLYGAVFQDELRDAWQRSLALTRTQQARMRLRLADTPELAELPWEFLYDPRRDRFLAQSRRVGRTQDS